MAKKGSEASSIREHRLTLQTNNTTTEIVMAIAIKVIPTLHGDEAARFVEKADAVMRSNSRTDITAYMEEARDILRKANL